MWLSFKIWFDDATHKIVFTIIALIVIGVLGTGTYLQVQKWNRMHTRVQLLEKDASKNDKYFSQLWEKKQTQSNDKNSIILTYDLFLKKPFTSAYTLNTALQQFITSVKDKYNVNTNQVRAIGIRIYDRKITWDKGLQPRAIAFYSVDQSIANKALTKEAQKQNNDNNTVKNLDGTQTVNNAANDDSLGEQSWNYTTSNTGKINYNHYELTVVGYHSYNQDNTSRPLTDQEFAFWLKLKLYEKALASTNIESAAALYMNYDLGGMPSQDNFVTISKDFEEFDKRQNDIGDTTDYYPNSVTLKQQLAVYRPQLLYYILSGKNVKSRTEAQKELIQAQPSQYSAVIKAHNKEAAKTTDKYGAQNYYKGDPFVAILGPYKKTYPTFSRPDFSPNLQENSAFFSKVNAPGN